MFKSKNRGVQEEEEVMENVISCGTSYQLPATELLVRGYNQAKTTFAHPFRHLTM